MSLHLYYRRIPSLIQDATIPIYYASEKEGPLTQDRSGILIQIGGRHFLVTAFHEPDGWFDQDMREFNDGACLFTSSGEIAFHWMKDRGPETVRIEWENYIFDPSPSVDLAIFELTTATVEKLVGKKFVQITAPSECNDQTKTMLVYGHPFCVADGGDPHDHLPSVWSPSCWREVWHADQEVPHLDLVFRVSDEHYLRDDFPNGTDEKFKGLSGCGIWVTSVRRDGWFEDDAQLIGLFTRFAIKGASVGGTAIHRVMDLITAKYPGNLD